MITTLDEMTLARLEVKNAYQELYIELKEDYGLSQIEARALISRVEQFNEELHDDRRSHNQILKQVVAIGEPAGKKLRDCRLVNVKLTMYFTSEDRIEKEKGIRYLKKLKVHQLAWEAYAQGGLLSYEDIESILLISQSTIKRMVREYRDEGIVVPTRGQMEDIGPGVTHKERIIDLLVRGYRYAEVMVQTGHTEASIENYERRFVRVAYFYREGKNEVVIRNLTGYSEGLIRKYIQMYKQYNRTHFEALNTMLQRFHRYVEYNNDAEKKIG
jgi:hypothetical protein